MNNRIAYLKEQFDLYNFENSTRITYIENESLSAHSSFRIGGKADLFIAPSTQDALIYVLEACKNCDMPIFLIGRGTNLLFDDSGFRGAIISTTHITDISVTRNVLTASCGASLADVVKTAKKHSLGGISYLYGIPGSVGGAVYMNAGAYGGEIADVLLSSTCFDLASADLITLNANEHCFGYRTSSYTNNRNLLIVSAEFCLNPADPKKIEQECSDYISRRKEKQPLEYPSAGSSFKRAPGHYTAQLIDSCGLKGFRVGDAAVSQKHAGFIINLGKATSNDVLELMKLIEERIWERFGVRLEREVIYVCPTPQK